MPHKDPEKRREYHRLWRKTDAGRIAEKKHLSSEDYREKKKKYNQDYRKKKRSDLSQYGKIYNRKYRRTPKGLEISRLSSMSRRARQANADGTHTLGEWENLKAQYNWTCPACGKRELDIKLTADHIIPLILGGSNNIENIQPLCKSCNSSKFTKIIKY